MGKFLSFFNKYRLMCSYVLLYMFTLILYGEVSPASYITILLILIVLALDDIRENTDKK